MTSFLVFVGSFLLLFILFVGLWGISKDLNGIRNALGRLNSTLSGYEQTPFTRIADRLETLQEGLAPTVGQLKSRVDEVDAGLEPQGPRSRLSDVASTIEQLTWTLNQIHETLTEES